MNFMQIGRQKAKTAKFNLGSLTLLNQGVSSKQKKPGTTMEEKNWGLEMV